MRETSCTAKISAWEYPPLFIDYLHQYLRPLSRERIGEASRSEIKRWFDQGAVELNGERIGWNHEPDYGEMRSIVLFPKGSRVTFL